MISIALGQNKESPIIIKLIQFHSIVMNFEFVTHAVFFCLKFYHATDKENTE